MDTSTSSDSVSQSPIVKIRVELEPAHAAVLAQADLSASPRWLHEPDWRRILPWFQRSRLGKELLSALPLSVSAHADNQQATLEHRLSASRLVYRLFGHESPYEKASIFRAAYTGYKHCWAQRRPVRASHLRTLPQNQLCKRW